MATKKVNTATLIRGEIYSMRHPRHTPQNPIDSLRFKRDVPVIIEDKEILAILEDEYDETTDGDGEIYEKPRFRIERGVDAPVPVNQRKVTRLDGNRPVRKRPRRRA